jgi:hypothetical protein
MLASMVNQTAQLDRYLESIKPIKKSKKERK